MNGVTQCRSINATATPMQRLNSNGMQTHQSTVDNTAPSWHSAPKLSERVISSEKKSNPNRVASIFLPLDGFTMTFFPAFACSVASRFSYDGAYSMSLVAGVLKKYRLIVIACIIGL